MLGTAALFVIGLLSAAPFDGWSRPTPPAAGAEAARLYLRSLFGRRLGRLVERSGSDRLTLWLFGLPVHLSRGEGLVDVLLPNGLVVRGRSTTHGSVELFAPVLPEFNGVSLVLVPKRRAWGRG